MTRWLLAAVGEAHGAWPGRVLLALIVLTFLPLAIVVDGVGRLAWSLRVRRVLGETGVRCPRGHLVGLTGSWTCPCGTTFDGHGFEDCPGCGARSHVTCACSLTCENPLGLVRPS